MVAVCKVFSTHNYRLLKLARSKEVHRGLDIWKLQIRLAEACEKVEEVEADIHQAAQEAAHTVQEHQTVVQTLQEKITVLEGLRLEDAEEREDERGVFEDKVPSLLFCYCCNGRTLLSCVLSLVCCLSCAAASRANRCDRSALYKMKSKTRPLPSTSLNTNSKGQRTKQPRVKKSSWQRNSKCKSWKIRLRNRPTK